MPISSILVVNDLRWLALVGLGSLFLRNYSNPMQPRKGGASGLGKGLAKVKRDAALVNDVNHRLLVTVCGSG